MQVLDGFFSHVLTGNFKGVNITRRVEEAPSSNPYPNGLPDSLQQKLADDCAALFKLFLKYNDKVTE